MRRPSRCRDVVTRTQDYERIDVMGRDTFLVVYNSGAVTLADFESVCLIEPGVRDLPRDMRWPGDGESPAALDLE